MSSSAEDGLAMNLSHASSETSDIVGDITVGVADISMPLDASEHNGIVAPPSSAAAAAAAFPPLNISANALLELVKDPRRQRQDKPGAAVLNGSKFFTDRRDVKSLETGTVLYHFSCKNQLIGWDLAAMKGVVNLTGFENELRDNFVPKFDVTPKSLSQYTSLIIKTSFLIPGIDVNKLADPAFMSSADYNEGCQPDGTQIWRDPPKSSYPEHCKTNTFRITKPIIPRIYSITVQFRVSRLTGADLISLEPLVGARLVSGLLLERTKRSVPPKKDATRTSKTVLLFTTDGVENGVIMTNITVILQSGFPRVIQGIVDSLGKRGKREAIETAIKTRRYLQKTIPL